jgi:hypothetical protein
MLESYTDVRRRIPLVCVGGGSLLPTCTRRWERCRTWRSQFGAWQENRAAMRQLVRCLMLHPRFAEDIGLTPPDIVTGSHAPVLEGATAREAAQNASSRQNCVML